MVNKYELAEAISGLKDFIVQKINNQEKQLKKYIEETLDENLEKKFEVKVKKVYKEVQDRKEKERNIIIFGIPEDKSENLNNEVAELLKEIDLEEVIKDLKFAARLGKYSEKKSRPVKAGFYCTVSAEKALRNANKLKNCKKKIYINEDLTQNQIKDLKEMRETALLMNLEDGDLKEDEKWIVTGRRSNPVLKKIVK